VGYELGRRNEVVVEVGWGCEEKGKGDTKNMLFSGALGPRAVYVHYFKDIRQGALQSDCVMHLCGVRGYTASYM